MTACPSPEDDDEEEGDENKCPAIGRLVRRLKEEEDEEEIQRVELEAREMSLEEGGGVNSGDCWCASEALRQLPIVLNSDAWELIAPKLLLFAAFNVEEYILEWDINGVPAWRASELELMTPLDVDDDDWWCVDAVFDRSPFSLTSPVLVDAVWGSVVLCGVYGNDEPTYKPSRASDWWLVLHDGDTRPVAWDSEKVRKWESEIVR